MDVLGPALNPVPVLSSGPRSETGAGVLGPTELAARLRDHGLRVTAPRRFTYAALAGLAGHRSADEVYQEVLAQGGSLSRTSVYAALVSLVGAGVVLAADAGPGRALYEAATEWHHHVVCRSCGRVDDVACVVGERPCLEADLSGWGQVDEAQVIFRGICAACAASTHGPGATRGGRSYADSAESGPLA